MKDISTLVPDIYSVVEGKGGWDATITDYLASEISKIAEARFSEEQQPRGYLGMSSLGHPCKRKIWYDVNMPDAAEPLAARTLGMFFYGDLLEALVLSLAKAAGHEVTGEQDVMRIGSIKGHRDAVIDGVTVDVKSTHEHGMFKFRNNGLYNDDPFGYVSQLSSYVYAGKDDPLVTNKTHGAFIAVCKSSFELLLDVYDFTDELATKEQEVAAIQTMVSGPIPEERMPDKEQSKTSPNKVLKAPCSYCQYKRTCWPDLRTFMYGTPDNSRPVHFTKLVKYPQKAEEVL